MPKKKVGILRGGKGDHYVTSVMEGGKVLAYIVESMSDRWEAHDIFIDKDDVWHHKSLPIKPADLVYRVDIVWNAAHPRFSKILDDLSIPHISPSSFSATMAGSREMLEEHAKSAGINMPRSVLFPVYQPDVDGDLENCASERAQKVFQKFAGPWIVRSYSSGSHTGVRVVKTYPELVDALKEIANSRASTLVEELIDGRPTAVHSLSGFRGEDVYVFPSSGFSPAENEKLTQFSKNLHKHLGIAYYLKSDMLWHPKRGMYVTNITVTPDLRKGSHLEESSLRVGANMKAIVEHILHSALA